MSTDKRTVPAELVQGPEDGRILRLSLGPDGPITELVITARIGYDQTLPVGQLPPMLHYRRAHQRRRGGWVYLFAGIRHLTAGDATH
ncbi:hypothetical protein GCM10010174_88900 [Kutzneria viridogrisea]|uniref:Uncharacterized protein n=1 Tax=Kutzneria viridogrisea TaxID=47990 RepID=A0ABR6BIT7_9PSEU|nr:hypothetical protein [Kutzneria viridogrisea]